jgi:UDP-glucose 4-epimerase
MTILITGGAGFIGGHTVLALLDRGEIPIVLDDPIDWQQGGSSVRRLFSLPATSEILS